MFNEQLLIILNQELVLKKDGYHDLVYVQGTLLKVKMTSNDHIVVMDENSRTFILNNADKDTIWSYL